MNNLKPLVKKLIPIAIAATSIATITGCSLDGQPNAVEITPVEVTPTVVTPTAVTTGTIKLSAKTVTVVDGYFTGCTVEDSLTPISTKATEIDSTNSPGVYRFPIDTPPFGAIISSNCIDASTGKTIPTLRTPALAPGATEVVATPLAALVQAGIDNGKTLEESSADIATAFNIPTSIDLATYDPIADMADTTTDTAVAAQIQAAATQIMAAITAVESAEPGRTDAVLSTIATQAATAASSSSTVDLTDSTTLSTIITDSVTDANIDSTVSTAIADAVAAANTTVKNAANAVTTASTAADVKTFLVTSTASVIVVDDMKTEIQAAVGGNTASLVTATSTVTADTATAETTQVIEAGLTSVAVAPVTATKFRCNDGSLVDGTTDANCPVSAPRVQCGDGSFADTNAQCPVILDCPNGTSVYSPAVCPTRFDCGGNVFASTSAECPVKFQCPNNGPIVDTEAQCPTGAIN